MKGEEGFDEFWKLYPRKCAKGDARKAWQQTAPIRPPLEKLIRAVIVARATEDWRKDGGKFVPYPATWLRAERWEDVHEVEIDRVRDGHAWHETVGGIEKRAKDLNMEWNAREETFQQFARRVKAVSDSGNVVPIQRVA
jgi:hypothetical protein